jgi:hypothetical protein
VSESRLAFCNAQYIRRSGVCLFSALESVECVGDLACALELIALPKKLTSRRALGIGNLSVGPNRPGLGGEA